MKGFKATYNLKCRDVQFEVGKTYKIEGELEMCKNGFHFCQNIQDTLHYYNHNNDLVFLEVEALGKVISKGDKSCTNEIKILRIIDRSELDFIKWDDQDNVIYFENSIGYWYKKEYDKNNNVIYFENSIGYWYKKEYDKNNNVIYCEYSDGYWTKREYDQNNKVVYYKDSKGYIEDNRPKQEITMDEIAEKFVIPEK